MCGDVKRRQLRVVGGFKYDASFLPSWEKVMFLIFQPHHLFVSEIDMNVFILQVYTTLVRLSANSTIRLTVEGAASEHRYLASRE